MKNTTPNLSEMSKDEIIANPRLLHRILSLMGEGELSQLNGLAWLTYPRAGELFDSMGQMLRHRLITNRAKEIFLSKGMHEEARFCRVWEEHTMFTTYAEYLRIGRPDYPESWPSDF